jgi:hypothetical protein
LIGNIPLSRGEYDKIKGKLIEDIRNELKSKKLPTIIDLIMKNEETEELENETDETEISDIELAFSQTTDVIFGKKLKNVREYENWLMENIGKVKKVKSALSKEPVYISPLECLDLIKNNTANMDEALKFGENKLTREELEGLNIENAKEIVSKINTVSTEIAVGENINVKECSAYAFAVDIYRSAFAYWLKHSAYSFYPKESEYCFGVSSCFFSKFSIRCNDSDNVTRCFELDGCSNCSDSYFCHNCEGLSNCMFCFNVKSLRYAIGNVEVGREEFMRIKKLVLDEVVKKLEKNKKLDLNIYNLRCK